MRQPFLFLYVCISTVCHASTGDLTSVHSSAISVHEVGNRGETILEERAFAPGSDRPAFSTPEDLEDRADTPSLGRGSVRTDASHEPISPGRNEGNRGAHSGFALSVPDTAEATTNSQVHAGSSLNLSERFKDGVRNTEWEKALAMIPEKVKVVPSPCVQGFKRAYTSFADVLSLFSLIMYGISGVASGLGGIDYLSHNAFLKPDVMVTVVGLGLIGT
ncbi:MAG TPA: hypothetical protein DIC42_03330, partial [Holosporales bacterium]|nr:hypothetical protein [Holosporales bacterium]